MWKRIENFSKILIFAHRYLRIWLKCSRISLAGNHSQIWNLKSEKYAIRSPLNAGFPCVSVSQLFFNQGLKDSRWLSASACLPCTLQNSTENLIIESSLCAAGHKPVCNVAKAGAVGLIAGLDNAYQCLVERKCSKRIRRRKRSLRRIRIRINFLFFLVYVSFGFRWLNRRCNIGWTMVKPLLPFSCTCKSCFTLVSYEFLCLS